jgi:hypothetical protein
VEVSRKQGRVFKTVFFCGYGKFCAQPTSWFRSVRAQQLPIYYFLKTGPQPREHKFHGEKKDAYVFMSTIFICTRCHSTFPTLTNNRTTEIVPYSMPAIQKLPSTGMR